MKLRQVNMPAHITLETISRFAESQGLVLMFEGSVYNLVPASMVIAQKQQSAQLPKNNVVSLFSKPKAPAGFIPTTTPPTAA